MIGTPKVFGLALSVDALTAASASAASQCDKWRRHGRTDDQL